MLSIPMSEIYVDESFNSRDKITIPQIVELAKSIATHGQKIPVILRPSKKEGFKYDLIAGFRRFRSLQYNNMSTIMADIRYDLESDDEAIKMNLIENLERTALTRAEEAKWVAHYTAKGYSIQAISDELGKTKSWVETRAKFVTLQPDVRQVASDFKFTDTQIANLYRIKDVEKRYELLRKYKSARQKNKQFDSEDIKKLLKDRRVRIERKRVGKKGTPLSRDAIFEMSELIQDQYGFNAISLAMNYCAGDYNRMEFLHHLKTFKPEFVIPDEEEVDEASILG